MNSIYDVSLAQTRRALKPRLQGSTCSRTFDGLLLWRHRAV